MSVVNLTSDGEFRYIVQWFNEWSELQREDFIPILVEYLKSNGVYVNGIVSGITASSCSDKPMSLFQCRIKLFREWSKKWPEDFKEKLREKVIDIEPKFADKIQTELDTVKTNGMNGYENGHKEESHHENNEEFKEDDLEEEKVENGVENGVEKVEEIHENVENLVNGAGNQDQPLIEIAQS